MKPNTTSTKPPRSKSSVQRSECPISCTLDLLGDKWTLLVVRDLLMFDKHLYSEILQSKENIPTNILADRLRRLEEAGIITKEPYQQNPVRYAYRLSAAGMGLHTVLKEIIQWANKHLPATGTPPESIMQRLDNPAAYVNSRSVGKDRRDTAAEPLSAPAQKP